MDGSLSLDDVDHRILELLREDGRMTMRAIGKRVGLPDTTVHSRVRRMKTLGVIKGFTVVTDVRSIGVHAGDLSEFIDACARIVEGQRKEVDLLWASMRSCVRRIEAVENRGH